MGKEERERGGEREREKRGGEREKRGDRKNGRRGERERRGEKEERREETERMGEKRRGRREERETKLISQVVKLKFFMKEEKLLSEATTPFPHFLTLIL